MSAAGIIGLCARAGRLVSGESAVVDAIRRGAARVVIVDGGASGNAIKMIGNACENKGIDMVFMPEDELGDAIGKPGRMAAAVTDSGFADKIYGILKNSTIDKCGGALRE